MKKTPVPKWKIGDSVRVKKGVYHMVYKDICIEGWQGRVVKSLCTECNIQDDCDDVSVMIEFDSITLQNMPAKYLKRCIKDGFKYTKDSIFCKDVERAKPRDTMYAVQKARKIIRETYQDMKKQTPPQRGLVGNMLKNRGYSIRMLNELMDVLQVVIDKLPQKSRNDLKRIEKELIEIMMKDINKISSKTFKEANTLSLAKSKIKRSKRNLN